MHSRGLVVFTSLVALSSTARAQSVTLEASAFRRGNADDGDPRRTEEADGINRAECERAETWHYEVVTAGHGGETLTAFAGHDCDEEEQRSECAELESVEIGSDTEHSQDVELDAGAIARGAGTSCTDLDETIRIWFLVPSAAGSEDEAAAESFAESADIHVDTIAPDPPTDLEARPGDTRVELDWKGDSETDGYYVTCSRSDEALPAGTEEEGCVGDATTPGFAAGATFDPAWRCDASDPYAEPLSGTSEIVDHLADGVQARFAVVTVDEMGNPGKLSEVACATPQEVDDFFDQYREAGGRAGGGDCGIAPGHAGTSGHALLGLAGAVCAVCLGALRRRRP